ncbi:hypothetical protein [Cupriavidus sp. AU9028]|uniref:hypothetical protein n=1 Tax=Cupriavidus sp. AU9028 TaxID=2871157 RepID=UPI002105E796|nr:hypothetical protein [Cupriavidus sp. AU9028]
MPLHRTSGAGNRRRLGALTGVSALAAALMVGGCAVNRGASRQFDVDAFLRAPDTTLPEVLTNPDFLAATRASTADCAAMLQSERNGVLEELPGMARGDGWLWRPAAQSGQVWLVASRRGGERTCHGPLPAEGVQALVGRAGG